MTTATTTKTDTRPAGFWTSADQQRDIDCAGLTMDEAMAFLLGECADDEQRVGILAGTLEVAS